MSANNRQFPRVLLRSTLTVFLLVAVGYLFVPANSSASTVRAQFYREGEKLGPVVVLEVASDDTSRRLGLMYRESLDENHGMLFVFADETNRSFWMKNTKISLDIIFLDSSLRVDSIQEKAKPFDTSHYPSKGAAKYVVELPAGFVAKWQLTESVGLAIQDPIPEAR